MIENEKPQNDAPDDQPGAQEPADGDGETVEPINETINEPTHEPTAEERLAEINDQLLRSLAELENTRRRAARDRSEALKFGAMGFARDMLGVVDNLQRALKAMQDLGDDIPDATRNVLDGVAATERDLLAALARHKVTPLSPLGEKFDPNLHEALFEAPGTGQDSGTIIEIVETGYMMEERLLRPAKVGIAKD
ncbi:MAG: Protein GrpE [Alphaproteobacteria bacterium]|nr:MAG: Protein GrpE [Alphaproteobacteria bacterium]